MKPPSDIHHRFLFRKTSSVLAASLVSLALISSALAGCSSNTKTATNATTVATAEKSSDSSAGTDALIPATPAEDSAVAVTSPESPAVDQISGSDLVDVVFDFPDVARPLKEVDRPVVDGTKRLALKVSGLTYHGVVCGFSIKGTRPESPAIIHMTGTKANGSAFDSGPISVAWTSTDPPEVSSGGSDNNGWNFLSDANPNRSGPGWVVSLGGVTPAGVDSTPKTAACSLELGTGTFSAANGPVGYWAGFARN
jgi:hypothetical protein